MKDRLMTDRDRAFIAQRDKRAKLATEQPVSATKQTAIDLLSAKIDQASDGPWTADFLRELSPLQVRLQEVLGVEEIAPKGKEDKPYPEITVWLTQCQHCGEVGENADALVHLGCAVDDEFGIHPAAEVIAVRYVVQPVESTGDSY